MLGAFKRRWKPKRVVGDSIRAPMPESEPLEPPERPARLPPLSQDSNQIAAAYDTTLRWKTKALQNKDSEGANHLANRQNIMVPSSPTYPMAPNICVEGGRIEFVKPSMDVASYGVVTPPSSPLGARSMRSCEDEKFDGDKEALEARIRQLEQRLEAEAVSAQKDRLAVARLQHQLSKRTGGVPSDAERARGDVQARLARAEHEAERANTRLRAAHRELARMEETVRSLLQYKTRVESLKQEKLSLSAALEARSSHYQTSLAKLSTENETLRSQVSSLQAEAAAAATKEDHQPTADVTDPQRRQYERCLDDVANQVVRALLSQKGLREELGRLSVRARDLEAQNRALGALLVRQLRPRPAPSPASPPEQQHAHHGNTGVSSSCCNSATISSMSSNGLTSPLTEKLLNNEANDNSIPIKKCIRKDRLCRSNEDIASFKDSYDDKKRFSAGNIVVSSCIDRLCSENSIISFNDEPFSDIMSVCVSHHTFKLSAEDKRRHQILTDLWTELKGIEVTPQSLLQALKAVDPALWAPPERPLTLNLKMTAPDMLSQCLHRLSLTIPDHMGQAGEDEAVAESPESGNRDEGYSTMSSDVQIDPSRQGEPNRELEDLKEASDETDNQVLLNMNSSVMIEDKLESDIFYIPLNLAVSFNPRNSFPPTKNILPFQHIMRSFSDSHLCLKLTTSTSHCGENCFSFSSPISSSPSMFLLDVTPILPKDKKGHPLRRTRGTTSLASPSPKNVEVVENGPNSRNSWVSNIDEQVDGCQYDADYVQHWLQLDDTRSALQQQHRDLLELDYDQAELEDWSLNLSCEDLQEGNWKRNFLNDATTPGQISLSTLPSIQENNALELEEDVSECLWNNSSYMVDNSSDKFAPLSLDNTSENHKEEESHWPYPPTAHSGLPSPGGSWSSIDNSEDCGVNNECFYNNDNLVDNDASKRSSAAMSGYSDEPESSAIGTDFTRDFYRLVKFESTKSLASNSSRGLGAGGLPENSGHILKLPDIQITMKQDREQALQNVLNFIAEQQKYCHNREELDSLPSRPTSEIRELPPPFIDSHEFSGDDSCKRLSDSKYTDGSCRNSFGSEIIYSENESCDIILSNDCNSMYNDVSPDLKKIPRIIDNQSDDFFSDSDNYLSGREYQSAENEIDEQHLLKVYQKNEINKNTANSSRGMESPSFYEESSSYLPSSSYSKLPKPSVHHHSNEVNTTSQESIKTQEMFAGLNSSNACNYSDAETLSMDREMSSNSLILNSSDSECSLLEDVMNACKRGNGSLVTVPEEEETQMENSLTQTSDSMTTSVSTSDTVATEICKNKKKTVKEKSKIPIPSCFSSKKSQIPVKSKSKIPVLDSVKGNSKLDIVKAEGSKANNASPSSIIVSQGPSHSRIVSFHEAATSKDVIDELNRMIRKGDEGVASDNEAVNGHTHHQDKALWCPTGWVHVEHEIDFSDPKARANLLDVMLASSDSSPSPTSSCAGSFSSDSGDERADYSKLHRLHRYRRQKKAAALRERGLAVLRFSCLHRPTIIGRNDFFVRYGKQERDAVACFDFLEEISTSVNAVPSCIEETSDKCVSDNHTSIDSDKASQKSTDVQDGEREYSCETLSDSCAVSLTGSDMSFQEQPPQSL